jgi:hypothetical protein
MDMATIYANRFSIEEQTAKDAVWQVLCRHFFQKYIPYYSVNYETYICDGVEYPQIWANEVIIGPHIQPAGYFSNPAKLKNQP